MATKNEKLIHFCNDSSNMAAAYYKDARIFAVVFNDVKASNECMMFAKQESFLAQVRRTQLLYGMNTEDAIKHLIAN